MKKIMTRAHQIAKTLEGNYQARLSLALRMAWKEAKAVDKVVVVKETAKAKMITLTVWDSKGYDRKMNVWFPNGWLEENNAPKSWAVTKKQAELSEYYGEFVKITGVVVA